MHPIKFYNNMEDKVLDIIKEVLDLDEVKNDISQQNCVKWDSLNHLNLILEIESEFNVSYTPEEIANIKSANDIIDSLNQIN